MAEEQIQDDLHDRGRGVLLASAVGDALGATVEFMSPGEIRSRFGVHRDIIGGGWLRLVVGEVTDDTQMALCIAHSIDEQQRFDAGDIAERFVAWFESNPPDIGNTTRRSLEHLVEGERWDRAGLLTHEERRPNDASNGSVMRVAPVALHSFRNVQQMLTNAEDSSRITHANPLCLDGCRAVTAAIAALLIDPDADFVAAALDVVRSDELRRVIAGAADKHAEDLSGAGGVIPCLEAAFWAVAAHDTLEDALIAAVNLGNDADSTGAVAGGIAGARWGANAIPTRWTERLRARDELTDLADRLLDLA